MFCANKRRYFALRAVVAAIALSGEVAAAEWKPVDKGLWTFDGFLAVENEKINLFAVQFDAQLYTLELVGARLDGGAPTIRDLEALDEKPKLFSLSAVVDRNRKGRVFVPAGYPEDEKLPISDGLTRINGIEYSARDTYRAFKSALICVHEKGGNGRTNEPPTTIVFNAFERGLPLQDINPRVEDPKNCEDVIQTGPRIIEYRAQPGIARAETRTRKQNWVVFAIGNGPDFNYYFIYTRSRTNLYSIQQMLLKSGLFSQNDRRARVAVNLTSGLQAGIAIRPDAGGQPDFVGNSRHPHPTYLMLLKK